MGLSAISKSAGDKYCPCEASASEIVGPHLIAVIPLSSIFFACSTTFVYGIPVA